MSEIEQGLILSGFGVLITFSALGVLIILILALKTLFPARREGQRAIQPGGAGPEDKADLRHQAAAAAVAALLEMKPANRQGSLGQVLESPPGEWWRRGIDRILGKE